MDSKSSFILKDCVDYDRSKGSVIILDQTKLPSQELYIELSSIDQIVEAIVKLRVRGAPALGVVASLGISLVISKKDFSNVEQLIVCFNDYYQKLIESRPTAVNLKNGLDRVKEALNSSVERGLDLNGIKCELINEAIQIKNEDIEANIKMAEHGLSLIKHNYRILTYCNAGHLAVSRFGTALSPIYLGHKKGYNIHVFSCETRPLLQGSRLTMYELNRAGVSCSLICDNMVSYMMQSGEIDCVIVGCDRVAKNGDVANKIGTSMVAILAKYYNIPFYVIGPSSTLDHFADCGKDIIVEQRAKEEVTDLFFKESVAPKGVDVKNPAFDITSAELITAIITENGVYKYPYNFMSKDK